MSIFRNSNESAYVGGKKHWTDVIKNTGNGSLLIWKQPEEDFNTNSTLIVMPGEEAVFIKGGNIEAVFNNGTYKLSTENYPFISRLRNAFSGGVSTFNCVVYFVKTSDTHEIRWGTETPIQVRDKVHNIRTEARVRGIYKVRIDNSAKFLTKLIGSNMPFHTQENLNKYFAGEFQGRIKSSVSKFLNSLQQELIGLDAYMDELSQQIKPFINESLEDYGLKCVTFVLAGLDIDISKYDVIDSYQLDAIGTIKDAQADKAVMDILGDNWAKQQSVDVMSKMAENPGNGLADIGAGMAVGASAGLAFSGMAQQVFGVQQTTAQNPPASADSASSQGSDASGNGSQDDPVAALKKARELLDMGLITQEDYDRKKAEILSRM